MKPTFKTTALAILVSLGATACLSTSSSNNQQPKQVQPTNPNSQSKPNVQNNSKKSEAEQKAAEEKAKAEREAQQKAAEQKRLEEEAKIKAEEAKKAKDLEEKARLEREAKEKAEEAKRLEEERIKAEQKAKLEEENRQRLEKERLEREAKEKAEETKRLEEERIKAEQKAKLEEENRQRLERERLEKERLEKEKQSSVDTRVQSELNKIPKVGDKKWNSYVSIHHLETKSNSEYTESYVGRRGISVHLPKPYEGKLLGDRTPFELTDKNVSINLTNVTENDIKKGGQYLGPHSGTFTDPSVDGVRALAVESINDEATAVKIDEDNKNIDYLFINTPYSTYGALFTDEYNAGLFAIAPSTSNYGPLYEYVNDTTELKYTSDLLGDVTYSGDVIAYITRGKPHTTIEYIEKPKVDGKVTLNAHFGKRIEHNTVKGVIHSDTVGDIQLNEMGMRMSRDGGAFFQPDTGVKGFSIGTKYTGEEGEAVRLDENNIPALKGKYRAAFAGKDAADIIGQVLLEPNYDFKDENGRYLENRNKKGILTEYHAVFGATKQPK
ncbi:hypothetical protein EUX54_03280 [Haemophilus haemolyticus]|jgi:caldesmon|uniref:Uncharacterized protein n=1 Tax=Haemophilus haemolyticus TaxID=726 RepID=A0A502JSE8_HAEHA|nr:MULTISPECIES: MAP7 domain-containing protein [Haemophilus]MBS6047171.1 hypothetical protein [Haemophilus haemolyticus]MDK7281157.1 MAP7 domain-containing protein [Haemophilus seminalis]TPH01095.1 hypothetical protein EUX54_03280 [Haemophilus haemolyticus]